MIYSLGGDAAAAAAGGEEVLEQWNLASSGGGGGGDWIRESAGGCEQVWLDSPPPPRATCSDLLE